MVRGPALSMTPLPRGATGTFFRTSWFSPRDFGVGRRALFRANVFWDSGEDMYSIKVQISSSLSSEAALTRKFHPPSPEKLTCRGSLTGMLARSTCSGLTLEEIGRASCRERV